MTDVCRVRARYFQIRLLDEELAMLEAKASEAGMSKSEYVRNIIMFAPRHMAGTRSDSELSKLRYELNRIGNNINQIAFVANGKKSVDAGELEALLFNYHLILAQYEELILV